MPDSSLLPDLDPADLDSVPLERSETIPSAWYTDSRFHALDRQAVYGRTWQYVADLSRLSVPGDVVVTEVAGEPIIALRDKAGELRVFFNVCRHRGGPLALKDEHCDLVMRPPALPARRGASRRT